MNSAPPADSGRRVATRYVWCAAGIALCLFIAIWVYQYRTRAAASRAAAAEPPLLTVDPDRLDFGRVWEQADFPWTLPIRNNSDREIVIEYFGKSCNCVKIEPISLSVPPGETRDVQLTFDLHPNFPDAPAERNYSVEVYPAVKEQTGNRPIWTITGRVQSALRIRPVPNFGEHSEEAQPVADLETEVLALLPITDLQSTSSDSRFTTHVRPVLEKQGAYELTIAPRERLPRGLVSFTVALAPTLETGERVPEYQLPVRGRILADIQPTPPVVSLGARPFGAVAEETILLSSLAGRPFAIVGWEADSAGLSVERMPNYPTSFRVLQKYVALGANAGSVLFRVRAEDKPEEAVSIPVQYQCIRAEEKE